VAGREPEEACSRAPTAAHGRPRAASHGTGVCVAGNVSRAAARFEYVKFGSLANLGVHPQPAGPWICCCSRPPDALDGSLSSTGRVRLLKNED
jgi:hypothetical protein